MMTTVLIYFRRLGCLIVFLTYAGSSTVYAAPTFFLSPGSGVTGDVAWQAAVGAFTEFDLEGFACSSIQQNLTDGSTTITIGPAATGQEILCSPGAFAAAGGVFGTVEDRSLINRDSGGAFTANLTFAFSQPVAGFGLWIFDDVAATPDSFTMTVTESGGATTTSGVLDAAAGALGHQVEGFIGATSSVGITSATITPVGGGTGDFEVDHLQLGGAAVTSVDIDIKPGSDPNCFNINGNGVIPVAILGSATFDVLDIDTSTLFFAGLEVRMRGKKGPLCHGEFSNGDGFLDLVCQFEDDPSMWMPDSSAEATLTGEANGSAFEGTDSICITQPVP